MADREKEYIFWIATVGGKPEPLIQSLLHWKPEKVVFLPSEQTQRSIEEGILPDAEKRGLALSPGQRENVILPDAQNPTSCIKTLVENLKTPVQSWLSRGERYRIVIDWTGGTKTMSVALALVAHKWHNTYFSYIGGETRTNEGVGIVKTGSEIVLSGVNSWELLGYRVIEDAIQAYSHGSYGEGFKILDIARREITQNPLKSEIAALCTFMEGVDKWDKCRYKEAKDCYETCNKQLNNIQSVLANESRASLREHIDQAIKHLDLLVKKPRKRTWPLCTDLLANAGRRMNEGRHVDAVARLYHAIEAMGQVQLEEKYQIDASCAKLSCLPSEIPAEVHSRLLGKSENGNVKLALQDVYHVLVALKDPLGEKFSRELHWHKLDSPLSRRNQSIAGHGFEPVKEQDCLALWKGALILSGLTEDELIRFPKLMPLT